ncbi:SCO family protein [Siculibacillus lacustris]|uniref:SCO family protein n=1 Tax=Siculibacillus lacustris TaxID=1549641 RepID=A0A4Q9VJC5_9HYPH|nr:SCO family protein [Siculibacillus lacustris]TBW34499.1 SCO family protein [Siculibacillus lacustris]
MTLLQKFRAVVWAAIVVLIVGLAVRYAVRDTIPPDQVPAMRPVSGIGGPFAMVDQQGRPFTEADLKGRATAMFFGYTYCPDVCPTTLLEASQWMAQLGADAERFRVVFVTVDPERDTPAKLAEYLGSFDPRFVGLSGDRAATDKILAAYRVFARKVEGKDGDYTMDHTAATYLLDAEGRFVGVINFQEPTDKALAKIRNLITRR